MESRREISSIVPVYHNTIYLAKQKLRKGLSYSNMYTLYYTFGDYDAALIAFRAATFGLFEVKSHTDIIKFRDGFCTYYIVQVDAPPRIRMIFQQLVWYFKMCASGSLSNDENPQEFLPEKYLHAYGIETSKHPPGFEDHTEGVEGCMPNSFERDDLMSINLSKWISEGRPLSVGLIYRPDYRIIDELGLRWITVPPPPIRPGNNINMMLRFSQESEKNTDGLSQRLFALADRNYHQVGVIPIAAKPDGSCVVLISQERYEDKPWSFFTGRPITAAQISYLKTNNNIRSVRGSKTNTSEDEKFVDVDYFNAALREYQEESMTILQHEITPQRDIFIRGSAGHTDVALWPTQVSYDERIGNVFRRVIAFAQSRNCVDNQGQMKGSCRESHLEKVDATWLSIPDAIRFVEGHHEKYVPTGGINTFRRTYLQFLRRLLPYAGAVVPTATAAPHSLTLREGRPISLGGGRPADTDALTRK